jgi:hypothetical protein
MTHVLRLMLADILRINHSVFITIGKVIFLGSLKNWVQISTHKTKEEAMENYEKFKDLPIYLR